MTLDPIHQFNIDNFFTIGHIGGQTIAFTNSSAYMFLTVAVICLLAVKDDPPDYGEVKRARAEEQKWHADLAVAE
jgi:hypothetical protein